MSAANTTIADALRAASRQIPPAEARLLLARLLGRDAAWLIAHDDEVLAVPTRLTFAQWIARRAAGEPVAYIVGEREFHGRPFRVTPATLIPRPETELLVERALACIATTTAVAAGSTAQIAGKPAPTRGCAKESHRVVSTPTQLRSVVPAEVLDLGTGSGCIAITLALESSARLTAVERSPAALAVAQANAQRLGATVEFLPGDWYAPLAGRRFALIVANPPYVAAGDAHLAQGDLRFEPHQALSAGADGLDDLRTIIAGAPAHLLPGGRLLLEHGYDQGEAVQALLAAAGFTDLEGQRDLAGHWRISGGRLRAARPLEGRNERSEFFGVGRNTKGRPECFLPLEGRNERSEFFGVGLFPPYRPG